MKILFLSAEVAPFVTVGGLSQVSYFLPRALIKNGHSVRIFTAKHGAMDHTNTGRKPWKLKAEIENIAIPTNHSFNTKTRGKDENIFGSICSFSKVGTPTTYFFENKEYFELRANVFGYKDDHTRFALLSKACLEWLSLLKTQKKDTWWPDVIHANDWHTGYFLDLARNDERYSELLYKIPIVYTVHNFFYQGNINFNYLPKRARDDGAKPLGNLASPKLIKQNPLLRALSYADEINTVSPTHAIEVHTSEYSAGLDKTLSRVKSRLTGILNGLDTKEFDPATDPIIKNNYNKKNYTLARRKNKLALQKEFNLEQDINRPLIAIPGRISRQKGWELILEVLPKLLSERRDAQFIVMGQGEERYQNELVELAIKFPNQLGLHLQTDFRLPRRIYSGADFILIPSIFEPGGIVALEALRYGAVPIVRRTGGLNDIIRDFDPNTLKGNGFSFTKKSSWSLFAAIIESLTIFNQKEIFKTLVRNCLEEDFSWEHAAREYEMWYMRVIEERKRATSTTPHPAYISSQL